MHGLQHLALMRFAIFIAAIVTSSWACAQPVPLREQLPGWASKAWTHAANTHGLDIFGGVNPFMQRGDFDGDGKADLAILVQARSTKKIGILFLHRKSKPLLVGAGFPLGNAGDDFSWLDIWAVEDRESIRSSDSQKSLQLKTDAVMVAKEGSAGGLIYFSGGKYKWQQHGD
jgi:hypothetical protein